MIPVWILIIIAIVGVFVAAYRTWNDEHCRAERNIKERNAELKKIQSDWLKYGRHGKNPPQ